VIGRLIRRIRHSGIEEGVPIPFRVFSAFSVSEKGA
jgi:hypothetical protein